MSYCFKAAVLGYILRRALATETGRGSLCGMDAETKWGRHEKNLFAVFRLLISVNVNIL